MAAISPQHTFEGDIPSGPFHVQEQNLINAIEPDYKAFIPPNSLRRMTHLLKMGSAAALKCLQNSHISVPGAIVTGTGRGSLQDTERFLKDIRQYEERALNPTPFIQSTYNAVNGMIAVQQQCTTYNNTFVHRGFSFENALLDSMMLLQEGVPHTLTGAFDEISPEYFDIKSRVGHWKKELVGNARLYEQLTPGTIAGEGSAFFTLTGAASPQCYAAIKGLRMLYKPSTATLTAALQAFLQEQALSVHDIDLVLTGRNGDSNYEHYYTHMDTCWPQAPQLPFKHLCGEYDTAGAFAVWLGAYMLKTQQVPEQWFPMARRFPSQLKHILLYNHFFGEQHVMVLLSVVE
jgi:hypothetical protein